MAIEFHPDVVAIRLKQIKSARQGKPVQSNTDEKTSLSDLKLAASTTTYNLHGQVGLPTNRPGTLLDAYLKTKQVIEDHMNLLISNVNSDLQLGPDQAAATVGSTEYWSKENTAARIFSLALMGYEEGVDEELFVDQATAMIKQAYLDVGTLFGIELPEPIEDIRQAVMDALEQLKNGATLSEISFG